MGEISNFGVHLPLLRLDRASAAAALRWTGLSAARAGTRAVANWDEDALTLAVEAARGCIGPEPDRIVFASTSAPFTDRLHAALLVDALRLPQGCLAADAAGSRRAGTTALLAALRSSDGGETLIAAGEKRPTKAGSAAQLAWGDGAAAVSVGPRGIARLRGAATLNHDFPDVYASREHPTPYAAEERWVRDMAIGSILSPAIVSALADAGVAPGEIAHAVVPEPAPQTYRALAQKLGLRAPNHAEAVQTAAGDLGAAHPLFGLALALEKAGAGELILVVGFGSGCDALVLEATGVSKTPGRASEALAHGLLLKDYPRFLSLAGCLDVDWGPRSELEQKTAAPVLERYGRDVLGFVGGRDSTGNVQFPKTRIPVAPDADPAAGLADVRLAEVPARIQSVTADRLNFTPDPPFHFGLVQFENGARVLMEFCDVPPGPLAVGAAVRMRFRVKSMDRRRGFRTYFWKACPAERPRLED